MLKIIIPLLMLASVSVNAQISEGGMPYSYGLFNLKSKTVIPATKLRISDMQKLKEEDSDQPTPHRYSKFEEVEINIMNGFSTPVAEPMGTIWRYAVNSENALSIQLNFKKFNIPDGARLYIYNNDYSTVYGAFTNKNADSDSSFIVADFPGNELIIEYFEPSNAEFKGTVIIGNIGQAYRKILEQSESEAQDESYIDINCNEGQDWQEEKHAVCKITFRIGRSGYLCSGALLNNTANDGTPYFLTANHCINDTTVAKTVVAYFNYERMWCNGTVSNGQTLTGARLMTTGQESDFTLLKLNNNPPESYQPFFAGWDIGNYNDNQNTSIHHPEGIEKKISIDYDKIITYDYSIAWDEGETTPPSSHWQVIFDAGITSQGSSGGPLFSKQKRVIGQLHGGGDADEFFGKLSYSWNKNTAGYEPLKKFLDPKTTNVTALNGFSPAKNPPDAFFPLPYSKVCLNSAITLQEKSAFQPTSRTWNITPSTFTFLNGTNKNSTNPQISFNSAGAYSIKLNVANSNGKDSLSLTNAITAGSGLDVAIKKSLNDSLCFHNFDSLTLTGFGAESYTWAIESANSPFLFSHVNGDTAVIKRNLNPAPDTSYTLRISLKGTMGACSGTVQQSTRFIKVNNDNIANAIEIGIGTTKPFSNFCATIEANEPIPPADSCTGVKSWCDEYGDGKKIVENSVWFKFAGPSTGKAGLKSSGFDNEIAIYDAASYQDILNGKYTLLAANDDRSDTDANPEIKTINVQAGKIYWVQVDGSGGGTEGTFTLTLTDKNLTSTKEIIEANNVILYPQPADKTLTIDGLSFPDEAKDIKIFTTTGRQVYETLTKSEGDKLSIGIENLSPGIYILKISVGSKTFVKKFIKS